MQIIVSYIIKCMVTSGILTGYYYAVLRNKKFNAYNRVYLLAAMAISLITPFIHTGLFTIQPPQNSALTTVITVIANPQQQPAKSIDAAAIGIAVTALVSLVLLVILIAKIIWIYRVKKHSSSTKMHGYQLVETDVKQAPFSFLDNLFWRRGIALNNEGWQKVLHHELVHIRQCHTYDKLFAQVTVCIFWMNPFYWLMQRELAMIHEFIADEGCIKDGDTEAFAIMLLQAHNQGRYLNPQHSFFHSPIKRRLIMLTTSKHTPYSYMRRVLAIPIAVVMVALFSATVSHAQTDPKADTMQTKVKEVRVEKLGKVTGDSAHLVRLAIKAKNGKLDTTYIKQIRIVPANPGATGKGKLAPVTTGDEGPKKIIITRKNNTIDTVILKELESIQITGKPAKITFKAKGNDTSKIYFVNEKPIEIVGKPSNNDFEAKPVVEDKKLNLVAVKQIVVVGKPSKNSLEAKPVVEDNKINLADAKEIVVVGRPSKNAKARPAGDTSTPKVVDLTPIEVVGYPAKSPAKQ